MSMHQQIHDKLVDALTPVALEVINESNRHSGPATDSHFKVVVVTERFDGVPLVRRHRLVNETLAAELAGSVHALSIHAYTPQQWSARGGDIPRSPPCRGGSKADAG
ncbi:MAG: BolA/IbaG family iron-sulfur metabolism protein [Deltaproteobacteria bacterium]|nr:BolA/IbaG family iron-sulfur metabolism protein [Deltaproteobacteria bacterium]